MGAYQAMIPGGGWHAELEMDGDGENEVVRNVPLVAWALTGTGTIVPVFVPGTGGNFTAVPLTTAAVRDNAREWGIRSFRVYHPDAQVTSRTCSCDGMLRDPE